MSSDVKDAYLLRRVSDGALRAAFGGEGERLSNAMTERGFRVPGACLLRRSRVRLDMAAQLCFRLQCDDYLGDGVTRDLYVDGSPKFGRALLGSPGTSCVGPAPAPKRRRWNGG